MSELSNNNNKERDVLYLTLNKDDAKIQSQDITMNLDTNNNKKDKKHKKKCFKKENKLIKKNEKLTNKIIKLVNITKEKRLFHLNEAQILSKKANDLENLLCFAPGMDFKDLKKELIKIIKESKKDSKKQKKMDKCSKKQEKKRKCLLKKQEKMEKRKLRMIKKKEKIEKLSIIEKGRINDLSLININKNDNLEIFIDGYNIIGCDKLCRKYMRGKKNLARQRLLDLVYAFFKERNLNIGCQLVVNVWFDGFGKDFMFNNVINAHFSGKESVDDTLVKMLSNTKQITNKVVITSDKELTFRLVKLNVNCMKSGVFYKKYIENDKQSNNNNNENNVINMVIDGIEQHGINDDGVETNCNDLAIEANNNNIDSSSISDEDDDNDEDGESGDEFDMIDMELEGCEYPSPK